MVIGLTGGIGSGKSTVARLFEVLGCKVLNSDLVAKQCYFKPLVKEKVISLLGNEAYLNETTLNKAYISQKIFSDKNTLHQINQIIHPEVKKEFEKFVSQHPQQIIIKESALLFEAGLEKEVDKVVVVVANDERRIERTMKRDGSTHEKVLKQMEAQIPQQEKIQKAQFVIYNNEEQFLIEQVLNVMNKLKA